MRGGGAFRLCPDGFLGCGHADRSSFDAMPNAPSLTNPKRAEIDAPTSVWLWVRLDAGAAFIAWRIERVDPSRIDELRRRATNAAGLDDLLFCASVLLEGSPDVRERLDQASDGNAV